MPEQLALTHLLNGLLARPVDAMLGALHISVAYPEAPITNAVAMEALAVGLLLVFFVAVRASLSVETPGGVQHVAEMIHGFVTEQGEQIIGHGYERFVSYLTGIFLFVLVSNLMGLVPGLESPTANVTVPLGIAVLTFCYYHYHGVRANGAGYIKQFLGPLWWLSPLLFPIEIISHFARIMSLTVRLYANMFAGDLLTLAFFSIVPVGVPLVFLGLHLGVAAIQAYVFMLLAMIYLGLAISHDH